MCYITAEDARLVAKALFDRAERLQDDERPMARENAKQLHTLSLFFWKRQSRGSLMLPDGLEISEQVDLLELTRDSLRATCEQDQINTQDAVVLAGAVDSLLAANPVPGSFLVLQDQVEDFHDHGHLVSEGNAVYEGPSRDQSEEVGTAAFC